MKYLLSIILLGLISCNCSYSDEQLSKMKSPIVIIGITRGDLLGASVTVKDSTGKILTMSNCGLSDNLGFSRKINDTIK